MKKIAIFLLLFSSCAFGGTEGILDRGTLAVKDLIQEALKDGKAEGQIEGGISAIFQNATQSTEPVLMKITRIKQYSSGCGRLHVEMIQNGVKDNTGKKVQVNPAFEFSICPNGLPPKEVKEELDKRRIEALKTCTAKTERGGPDKESNTTKGIIKLTGCPSSGKVQLRYTGTCQAIQMQPGTAVNYELNKKGELDIQLRMPEQCVKATPAQQNQWSLLIVERDGLILGDVVTAW